MDNITPENSVAPIFLDTTPVPPADPSLADAGRAAVAASRENAIAKLMALGLTDAEVAALIGGT